MYQKLHGPQGTGAGQEDRRETVDAQGLPSRQGVEAEVLLFQLLFSLAHLCGL